MDGTGRDETQKCLHIALLGPAHVAGWIIDAFLLVGTVVATRSVRSREAELQLFFVIRVARHVHADHANCHHHRTVACQTWRDLDRIASTRRGSDEDGIGAAADAECPHFFEEVRIRAQARHVGALSLGQLDLVGSDIDAEHAAAGRL